MFSSLKNCSYILAKRHYGKSEKIRKSNEEVRKDAMAAIDKILSKDASEIQTPSSVELPAPVKITHRFNTRRSSLTGGGPLDLQKKTPLVFNDTNILLN